MSESHRRRTDARFVQPAITGGTLLIAALAGLAWADWVTIEQDGQQKSLQGTVLAQNAAEVLVGLPDGQMRLFPTSVVRQIQADPVPLAPWNATRVAEKVLEELGPGFVSYFSKRFVVVHNTDPVFVRSAASLLERLYAAFTNYFRRRGFAFKPEEFPLVAVVFATQEEFLDYAAQEMEKRDPRIIGFYSLITNRLAFYNMSPGLSGPLERNLNPANISTIVHEAVHQLAFNTGFHRRFSDPPLWVVEGMAMYFESPELIRGGWSGIGEVNQQRLFQFVRYLNGGRPADSLRSLVMSDDRIQNLSLAADAYAEAWALTYFLIRTRAQDYFAYLRQLSDRPYLARSSRVERLQEFERCFGPVDEVDQQMVRYVRKSLVPRR
jgi:hypothetical protein